MCIQLFFKILQINTQKFWNTHSLNERELNHFFYDLQKINGGLSKKKLWGLFYEDEHANSPLNTTGLGTGREHKLGLHRKEYTRAATAADLRQQKQSTKQPDCWPTENKVNKIPSTTRKHLKQISDQGRAYKERCRIMYSVMPIPLIQIKKHTPEQLYICFLDAQSNVKQPGVASGEGRREIRRPHL